MKDAFQLPLILIGGNDSDLADTLLGEVAASGYQVKFIDKNERIFDLTREFTPLGIFLEIRPNGADNQLVVLDRLKNNRATRHIPIVAIVDESYSPNILALGALTILSIPVSSTILHSILEKIQHINRSSERRILLMEPNIKSRRRILECLRQPAIIVEEAVSEENMFDLLSQRTWDGLILSAQMTTHNLSRALQICQNSYGSDGIPVILLNFLKSMKKEFQENLELCKHWLNLHITENLSELINQVTLFLHIPFDTLSVKSQELLELAWRTHPILSKKKVLVIDDDIRNIFALTSALERYQMQVLFAESGRDGIELLHQNPDVQIVLIDIMMPEMDGYEAIGLIRQEQRFKKLPIIALTAKAMQDDRERCLKAGATDYITKPVDTDQLFSTLRVWLFEGATSSDDPKKKRDNYSPSKECVIV